MKLARFFVSRRINWTKQIFKQEVSLDKKPIHKKLIERNVRQPPLHRPSKQVQKKTKKHTSYILSLNTNVVDIITLEWL